MTTPNVRFFDFLLPVTLPSKPKIADPQVQQVQIGSTFRYFLFFIFYFISYLDLLNRYFFLSFS